MKIHIYYRHYNVNDSDGPKRPKGFDYEKCFLNLLETLKGTSNYILNVVFDGNPDNNWITKYSSHYTLHTIQEGSDAGSYFKTADIIKNNKLVKTGDLIYFLENDYLHVDGWLGKVEELFTTYNGLDYVSLYDHKDKYFLPMYDNLVSKIFITDSHHWRSTPSTCGSFTITKERFDEDYDILSTVRGDHNKFLWLNKNRGRSVVSPIPGLSTHCMEGLMSPTLEW